jgi:spermidine synthase
VDGTLASLQSPGTGVTGVVWWALAAPVVLLRARRRPRALLLGLGGGSVGRALRELAPNIEMVGVERDRAVVETARRDLGLDDLGLEVLTLDARDYLARERRRFDLVIEDLFVGPVRSVGKPDWLLDEGYPAIEKRLRPGGIVSANTIHEMPALARAVHRFRRPIVSLDVRGYWNRIVVCGRDLPPPREVRRRLGSHTALVGVLSHISVRRR